MIRFSSISVFRFFTASCECRPNPEQIPASVQGRRASRLIISAPAPAALWNEYSRVGAGFKRHQIKTERPSQTPRRNRAVKIFVTPCTHVSFHNAAHCNGLLRRSRFCRFLRENSFFRHCGLLRPVISE